MVFLSLAFEATIYLAIKVPTLLKPLLKGAKLAIDFYIFPGIRWHNQGWYATSLAVLDVVLICNAEGWIFIIPYFRVNGALFIKIRKSFCGRPGAMGNLFRHRSMLDNQHDIENA
jgi:hypothetical protein